LVIHLLVFHLSTKEDFTQSGKVYDVVFEEVGKISSSVCKRSLKKTVSYLIFKSLTTEAPERLDFL
jgi:hypothetical protein